MAKSKRARALDISPKVKKAVWERDGERCIFCGDHRAMPNAHIVPRSQGGLGIEKNVVTACIGCHYDMDHTDKRKEMLQKGKDYLRGIYPDWSEEEVTYKKGELL